MLGRITEIGVGDLVRPRRSFTCYRVTAFWAPRRTSLAEQVRVQLVPETCVPDNAPVKIVRTLEQLYQNWRTVERAPAKPAA